MQILDDLRGALGALLDNARVSAPHLVGDIEAVNAKAAEVEQATAAAAPKIEAGASTIATLGLQLGEGGLEAYLTGLSAPYLGPASAPLAKVFVEGGVRAVSNALSAAAEA